ncbi:6-phospho-beta-glucosidase [Clostridium estertheticum]|uniref:6-phospho-beta-glucosidase n=1 Tax=Clostridium estertheticum TaxID=238834 RepID=UPI0013EE8A57|nr:6-phospho-beta-glucosidase [Clostridium estertheticum]MBZ9607412.1 6-phospho-beta-glucosidase [Clostridium estertheticum]
MTKRGLKIATIGGGSSYTPELIEGFIKRYEELPIKDIYLVDVEEGREKLEIVGALAIRMVEKAGIDMKIHLTFDRREAIKDADFVTTQFRVGFLDARIRDERIPLKHGIIGQETTGAGGFAKSQRTIPVILDICKDIEELAPEAWLINFTNPSGIITEAVLKYTKIKCIGLCNGPINMEFQVAKTFNVPKEYVYIDFVGLNHLLYGRKIFVKGKDVTNDFIEMTIKGKQQGLKNIPEISFEPEFARSLGMFPIDYLKYYYMSDKMLEEAAIAAADGRTRGEEVKKIEKELFELYKDPNLSIKPPQLEKRGGAYYSDAACSIINSIYNDKRDLHVANVMNNGTLLDLPDNVVIERNVIVNGNGAYPISGGHLPVKIRGLVQLVKAYEELTVEAGVTGDYGTALQALAIHPLVTSASAAKKVLDDIIDANKKYLPQYK